MVILSIYIFLIGLCVGSFLNVLLFRLDQKEGIIAGRSECPSCLKRLKWYDLIPLLSYLNLRGRCRYCKKEISYIYPLTEAVTACVITLYFWVNSFDFSFAVWFYLFVVIMFIALTFFDALYMILPDKIVLTAGVAVLVYDILFKRPELANLLLSGFIISLSFAIIYLVSRGEWMGFGDVKLVLVIGLILGYPLGLFAVIFSVWIAAIWGIFLMIFSRANLKTALPFGSFLSAMTIIFIIFENVIHQKANTILQLFF